MNYVKRICFLGATDACDPMKIGGCESFTRRLAIGLSQRDYSITIVLYGAEKNETRKDFLAKNVTLQYHKTFLGALKGVSKSKSEIVFELYIHKRYYPFYLAYKYKNREKKFAVVFMTSAESVIKKWFRKKFKIMFCKNVFAVSPHLVEKLTGDGIEPKLLLPPVPDSYFQPFGNKSTSKIVISYLGRIDENKGAGELEKILDGLLDSDSITIHIRGYYVFSDKKSVKLHETFMELSGVNYLATQKKECFYLPETEKDVVEFLSETDILVLPYKNLKGTVELPLLVLEGLAAGCVVLSTDVGDVRSVIDDDECVATSFEEFKEKLKKLCHPDELEIFQKRLESKNFPSTFSASKVVDRLIDYLR